MSSLLELSHIPSMFKHSQYRILPTWPKSSESSRAVSLLSNLQESVLKLKRLCSAFRNAPEDVTQLAEELDVIAALLVEVGGQRQQPYHTASSATTWERCVLACKNAGKASEGVIKVLERHLKTNRTLGGIRVAFKKEAVAELKSRTRTLKCAPRLCVPDTVDGTTEHKERAAALTQHTTGGERAPSGTPRGIYRFPVHTLYLHWPGSHAKNQKAYQAPEEAIVTSNPQLDFEHHMGG